MIYLSGNSENTIYTSVSVHKTMSKPTYLMSLTHQQTGKRWSFIPQNISSYYGAPYNNRYDIFKFDISGGTENLTGGTLAYYYQSTPGQIYQDSRYVGTDKWYLRHNPIVDNVFGTLFAVYDFSDKNIQVTGGTMTLDGTTLSPTIQNSTAYGANEWSISSTLNGANLDLDGLLEVELNTNSGTTISESWYVTSMNNVSAVQPWTFYGYDDKNDIVGKTLPITYINTPSVNIDEIGEFSYSIKEQSNPINLNPQYTTETLETGLAYIYQGFTDIYYDKGGDSVVYNPDNN